MTPGSALLRRWRGSLQLRVAVTTLVLCAVVVALLGWFLQQRLTAGVLAAKVKVSLSELESGMSKADAKLDIGYAADPATTAAAVDSVFADLQRATPTGVYDVALLSADGTGNGLISGQVLESSIPPALLKAVGGPHGREAYAYTWLRYTNGSQQQGLVAGGPVLSPAGEAYELFYFFPLSQEVATVALLGRVLLIAGGVLVLLLVGVALLVTHQVVSPVREAARSAQRLAAGVLDQRMRRRGSDEIAQLAVSFNTMAAALQGHIRQLEGLSRLQRRFVADVSHELRTPLTTVRMAADVLYDSRGGFSPEQARSAELLQAQLNRFEVLLGDLLEISRHDAGAVVLDAEQVDLRTVVTRAVDGTALLAERAGCRLDVELPPSPVVVEMDPRRIERVLCNLLGNAVEHGAGRPVEVRMGAGETSVAVTVRDHGSGLRPGEAALVFNRFWRADPSRARRLGGTGLGLSIALEDTRLHGGWLQAAGEPGQGATFRLTLPYRAGDSFAGSPLPLGDGEAARPDVEVPTPSVPAAGGVPGVAPADPAPAPATPTALRTGP